MNKKNLIRNQRIEIKMSQAEKDIWVGFAESMNLNPATLARNILIAETKSLIGKVTYQPLVKAYMKYLEVNGENKKLEDYKKND